MASRVKDDEKNERIIRNLLRLPDNRRCINCNSLGPQYVCTNFSTFVCTTCSGIHREFTHRVKSVSMAKFTPQEVSALQGGGNASAREIYLKEWDSQRNSLPDGSNIERLRDFIKHVYVDRRYTGERSVEKPPRAKMGETEEFNGNRRADNYQGGSRSPPYDNTSERRYGDRSSSGGRSPSYDQNNRQTSDLKKSPAREVVNDWRREDRFGNGRRSDERSSDGSSKFESRSPDHQRDSPISSPPPVVRPVRDILGDNVSPLRVIEPPKATSGKSTDGRAPTQRTASSSSLASSDANPSELKVEASFIDFDAVPEPPTVTVQQTQVPADASSVPVTTSSSNDWANFDSLPNLNATAPASNSVESLLSGLSVPPSSSGPFAPPDASSSFSSTGIQGSLFDSSFGNIAPPSVVPTGGAPVSSFGSAPTNFSSGGQWPTMNPQPSMFPGGIEQPVSGGSSTNKSWNPLMPNAYGPPGASSAQAGQAEAAPAPATGRNALPEDLFSMNYSYNPSPVPAWYPGAPYGSRVPMHYNTPMAVGNYQAVPMPTSINPFDVNEPSPVQATAFPSMASLQGALPKTATPSGNLHTPNYGYAPSVRAQTPSYPPIIPTSSFMGHEIAGGSMAPRPQGLPGFGFEDSAFASLNPNAQAGGLHAGAHPASSNFSTTSGNPFG